MGDHSESIQVDFDPAVLPVERLLREFWDSHDPSRRAWSCQYKSVLFFHDDEQRRLAEGTRDAIARETGRPVTTEIRPFDGFTPAEDYHQKYYLRNSGELRRLLPALFPTDAALRDSTVAARLNAYAGRDLPLEMLRAELATLGWSVEGGSRVEALLRTEPAGATR